ncbi:MAG: YncE family protein [Candidatus Sericytochromatia bacterium]|nr:YncE family protein [Candidatus Sericytochromatia bacterium]
MPTGRASGDPASLTGSGLWNGQLGLTGFGQWGDWEAMASLGGQAPLGTLPNQSPTFALGPSLLYQVQGSYRLAEAWHLGMTVNGYVGSTLVPGDQTGSTLAANKSLAVSLTGESALPLFRFGPSFATAPTSNRFAVGTTAGGEFKHRDIAYEGGFVLSPNTGENNLSLINVATGEQRTLTAGNNPAVVDLAITDSGLVAAIGNAASNTITLTSIPGNQTTTFAGGQTPTDVVVRADGKVAFMTNAGSNDVSVIDIDIVNRKEITRVPVGKRPVHIHQTPATLSVKHTAGDAKNQIWVMNDDGDSVTVIAGDTYQVLATIAIRKGHHKCAFSPTKAYISNITSNDVSVVDRTAVK